MAHDFALVAGWLIVLVSGLAACTWAHARGLSAHYVRDALHVGTSVWVLGWPFWNGVSAPIAVVVTAAIGVWIFPILARRVEAFAAFEQSVTAEDERWSGIELYVVSYAIFTPLGVCGHAFPAAAALFALALGDGLGGLVGRRCGRHGYPVLGGKRKTFEGSLAVAVLSGAAAWFAAQWFGASASAAVLAGAGIVAAVVEGFAPRATDNVAVPAAVFLFLAAVRA